ncbi:MAG TPA: hypothetical protein VHB68_07745, partial [Steroidobacteraceae bacterium]|nr:hypothetical protein [Steroidobacteraceae bacterium]
MSETTGIARLPRTFDTGAGLTAVIIGAVLGEYSLLAMPFIVTAMVRGFGLTESRAGDLVSAQLIAM